MTDPRFPIGKFQPQVDTDESARRIYIDQIAACPENLRTAIHGLDDQQLDTPYRDEGWTLRQVVHHLADSHINSYIRFKFALTEDEPTIKSYDENSWANLSDARTAPVEVSLALLESLHRRWVLTLNAIKPADWQRTFRHPELGLLKLDINLALYAWHGRHHVAHITSLRERMNW
jgi:hypothetical protein